MKIEVDRDWLVEVDSFTSLVAYRYARHFPAEVVESLKRLSIDARKLYKAADVQG